jgi:hypothetical protein
MGMNLLRKQSRFNRLLLSWWAMLTPHYRQFVSFCRESGITAADERRR